MTVKYPEVRVKLIGSDGNTFAIMGKVMREMRRAGIGDEEIHQFQMECTSGDYDNLLGTVMQWVEVD